MTARTHSPIDVSHGAQPAGAGTIGFATALHAQFLLLQRCGRTLILVGAAAIAIILTIGAEWWFSRIAATQHLFAAPIEHDGFALLSLHPWIVMTAAVWGIAVWWQESPMRREHVLAAPADLTLQELARIAAGGLWLLAMLALTTAAALLVQLAGGRGDALGTVAPAAWAVLFSGPLLAYTLAATVATATRRSIVSAIIGIVVMMGLFAFTLQIAIRNAIRDGDPADAFGVLRYSLFNALGGLVSTTTTHTSQVSDSQTTAISTVVHGASMMPHWIEASLLWWTIALVALAFVLWRRRRA
ncbi:MAG TPA: hypothetical protein VHG09_06205 [Longimicrobiales bacterium]|nr:hypothetical protein [Longimicrobiales bacterium]